MTGDCGDPDYEVIEFPTNRTSNSIPAQSARPNRPLEISTKTTISLGKCALCGVTNLFARCEACNENFCEACDDMNHKHPKRRGHTRRRILQQEQNFKTRPPLPPKGETQMNPPVPPPRRNRRNTQVGCALA